MKVKRIIYKNSKINKHMRRIVSYLSSNFYLSIHVIRHSKWKTCPQGVVLTDSG